ncbi:GNAT family N-acetyltransferase [Pelagibius marinus]|uniref:GNAT family N-acetyltransferase n=1 Tax=Pelagibius marinus TaxID=2762760 RepID=UPI001872D910|nr:GNAT family N-acetyltransferase [Pelagibius marinus]
MTAAAIQPAGPCDVALLAELYRRCFDPAAGEAFAGTPWSARSLAEVMAMPGVFGLLAVTGGREKSAPAGFLLARVLFEEAELLTLGVLPERRRAGLGDRLLQAGLAEAGRRGARRMTLEVAADNAGAQALYRGAGFAVAGRRRNYYRLAGGGNLDAVIFARALEGPESPSPGP